MARALDAAAGGFEGGGDAGEEGRRRLRALADLWRTQDKLELAVPYLQRQAAALKEALGANHAVTLGAAVALALAYEELKKTQSSIALWRQV
eukprot:8926465-Pyramimonas_sp.AAC.1